MIYKTSIIISIYDNINFLRVVLDSLKQQTEQCFEIVISEDASHLHVKEFIDNYPFIHDYQHLTQPDVGWKKNKALNRAILASKSDWLIFIDGDCVLHPRFVEYHLKNSSPSFILGGKRIKLNESLSKRLLSNINFIHSIQSVLLKLFFKKKKGIKFLEEGIFISPKGLFGFIPRLRSMHQLKGCNMSFSKNAILTINGFDEDYILPAIGEDIDLTWRFEAAGYKLKSVRNLAVQYHLFHKESWADQSENINMMSKKKAKNEYFCRNGIKKIL